MKRGAVAQSFAPSSFQGRSRSGPYCWFAGFGASTSHRRKRIHIDDRAAAQYPSLGLHRLRGLSACHRDRRSYEASPVRRCWPDKRPVGFRCCGDLRTGPVPAQRSRQYLRTYRHVDNSKARTPRLLVAATSRYFAAAECTIARHLPRTCDISSAAGLGRRCSPLQPHRRLHHRLCCPGEAAMSVGYKAVSWNRQKRVYDTILVTGVALYFGIFLGVGNMVHPYATIETLLIRAFGSAAFLLLTIVLCIGPLCRL